MNHNTRQQGFTLIEMLAVFAIMTVLIGIAIGASISWGRIAAMRGSVLNIRSSLDLARQWAMTHGTTTAFIYTNSPCLERGYYVITTPNENIGTTNYLAKGIMFTNLTGSIQFNLDGSCRGTSGWSTNNTRDIVLTNGKTNRIIKVYRLTGYATVQELGQ